MSEAALSPPAASTLCPQCGLCCRGALFSDVALEEGEDAAALARLGLELYGRGRTKRFRQPCQCFDGERCQIYAARPNRCRSFECRLLQRVEQRSISIEEAAGTVKKMRRQLTIIETLTSRLGAADTRWPLMKRYAHVLAQPLDLSGDVRKLKQREQLMQAVHRLTQILEQEFLE